MKNKIYLVDYNSVLKSLSSEFELVDDWTMADAVVVGQDTRGENIDIVANANLLGIPTVTVEHGVRSYRDYLAPVGKPLLATKLLVWGPKGKRRMVEGGYDLERIEVVGTTIFDSLKPRVKHKGFNVLFVPLHWDREIKENFEVAKVLRKIKSVKVMTKVVDDQDEGYYDNSVKSNRDSPNHLSICADVLSKTDVVVSLFESTFEFMAYYLDIPVVVVDNWKPKKFLDTYIENLNKDISNAANFVKLGELEKAIVEDGRQAERKIALLEEAQVSGGRMAEAIRGIMKK